MPSELGPLPSRRSDAEPDPSTLPEASDPDAFRATAEAIERAVGKVIVGQQEAVRGVLICLVGDGHGLLEGVPGVGKTSLALSFTAALGLQYNRLPFTPDLLPADITGTTVLYGDPSRGLRPQFEPGPVFCNLLLADEINRASPRTQSALLEAMQERTVTVAGTTRELDRPFCVLATQNPIEMQGTYPLPEAQLDRFLLKLRFSYPSVDELEAIVTQAPASGIDRIDVVAGAAQLQAMSLLAREVPASSEVIGVISRLLLALQPSDGAHPLVRDYVQLGPSPRGGQALTIAGRITALLDGRHNLSLDDVRAVALPALRHRLVLNFDAEREGIGPEMIVTEALQRLTG
ncbi:MAG TPA: AAA family ATPase [Solirubrobacteraceae bacterium]|nr:AAA family ATPase [Solirubrobacteraceae bacterium]